MLKGLVAYPPFSMSLNKKSAEAVLPVLFTIAGMVEGVSFGQPYWHRDGCRASVPVCLLKHAQLSFLQNSK